MMAMRFSIRDLLLVTALLAMALGWACHWRVLERRDARRRDYIERAKDRLRLTMGQNRQMRSLLEKNLFHQNERGYIILPTRDKLPEDLENEP